MNTNATPTTQNVAVKIVPNDKGNPPGKLADAELHFSDSALAGLKLIGFAIWERRNAPAETSPSRRTNTPSTASGAASRCCGRSLMRPRRKPSAT